MKIPYLFNQKLTYVSFGYTSPVDNSPLDTHTSPHSDTEIDLHQPDPSYDDFEENWNWDKADKEKTKDSTGKYLPVNFLKLYA